MDSECRNDTEIEKLLSNLEFKIYSVYENGDFKKVRENPKGEIINPITVVEKFFGKFELNLERWVESNNNIRINNVLIKNHRFEFWDKGNKFMFINVI